MLRCIAPKDSSGFTLAEILAMLIILGILTALATPNLLGLYNRYKVNDAFNELRSALQEAQANAIKTSKPCTVTLAVVNGAVTVSAVDPEGKPCIVNRTLQPGVALSDNLDPNEVTFSFKGNTTTMATLVLYWAAQPDLQKKCLVISGGIGIMRYGDYIGTNVPASVNATACQTKP